MKGMDTVKFLFCNKSFFSQKIVCLMLFFAEISLRNYGRTDKHEVATGVIAEENLPLFNEFPLVFVDS